VLNIFGILLAKLPIMPRVPRNLTVREDLCVHKYWRGHNKEPNISTFAQKKRYLEIYNEDCESKKYLAGSHMHAATIMTNHVHEVHFISNQKLFSDQMRRHHSRYGQFFNKLQNRTGKVAEGRPHTTLLQNENSEMRAVFYIHANPIRAKIVRDPRNYFWSTHRLYAFGKREVWMKNIIFPDWYINLGPSSEVRQRRYRELFEHYLKENGLKPQHFLRRPFVGTAEWVATMEKLVATWRKRVRPPPGTSINFT
jgi:putative transposase